MLKRLIISSMLIASLSGCDSLSSPGNTVVLDLDAIASATGQTEIIRQQVEKANQELGKQLQQMTSGLNEQLEAEKKKLGKKLSKKDKEKLQQLQLQAAQQIQQAKNLANQKSQQYKVALIQKLRRDITPIAKKIAKQRGADIVLTSNNSLIWLDPEADITDEVIAQIRAGASGKEASTAQQTSDEVKPIKTNAQNQDS